MRRIIAPIVIILVVAGVTLTIVFALDWLQSLFSALFGLAIIAVSLYLVDPNRAQIVASHIAAILEWAGRRVRRFRVKNAVEGHVNRALAQFNSDCQCKFSHPMKLNWVHSRASRQSFLENGTVIVKVDHREPTYKTIVDSFILCCSAGLLPEARPYMSPSLQRAVDLAVVDSILKENDMREGRIYLMSEVFPEEFVRSPSVNEWSGIMEELQSRGFFTRMILRELHGYPAKVGHRIGKNTHKVEISKFVRYVHRIAMEQPGDETAPLDFVRERLRVGVILVGKPGKLSIQGIEPYLHRIKRCSDIGIETLYLVGYHAGVTAVPSIAREAQQLNLATIIHVSSFNACLRDGSFGRCSCASLRCRPHDDAVSSPDPVTHH